MASGKASADEPPRRAARSGSIAAGDASHDRVAVDAGTWTIGIDMGGTFVDAVARGPNGRLHSLKHSREAGRLAGPVLQAIERLCTACGIGPAQVARIVHGSTVVTNLLLEQTAPPIAVLTTAGMGDLLVLARQNRRELYLPVITPQTPETSVFPRHLRFEIGGRIDANGLETAPLDVESIDRIASQVERSGVRAVAVCLLFSHRNPAHELNFRDALAARLPGLAVSLSSEVDPQPREFERFLATALDAYAKPVVADYLAELSSSLTARGLPEPLLMRSAGGIGHWRDVSRLPIGLAMSGPCAALQGIADALRDERLPSLVSLDVGGTSTDIGSIEDGRVAFGELLQCGELSVRLRCADVESLSVGGGSRVQVLPGRALRLGPQSQGAFPGPAAYGAGGDRATLTDALCVLGRLPPALAGGVALDRKAARRAIDIDVALPLGLSTANAAALVVRTAASAMAEALKMRSFQRGHDPADSVLVAAGGGGGQHAAEVALLAGIAQVRVLPNAGVISALGMLGPASRDPGAAASPSAWGDLASHGDGPRSIFASMTTVWVPPGWCWTRSSDDSLTLSAIVATRPPLTDIATADAADEVEAAHAASAADAAEPAAAVTAHLEPLRLALQGVVDRMQAGMMRAACSSIAREGGDCAAALFLPDGRLLAQARSLPLLLGSLIPAVAGVLKRFPAASMKKGDGFLMNDPWSGGTHLPDIVVVRPVVEQGEVIALAATILHHQDVGGMAPGSIPPDAVEVFQEGLRLPPVQWRSTAGIDANLQAVLDANSRTPVNLNGDLAAQWSAVSLGARELQALSAHTGSVFADVCDALIDQAEAMTRAALLSAPDGEWSWADALDGPGEIAPTLGTDADSAGSRGGLASAPASVPGSAPSNAVRIAVTLRKTADTLTIDFTGSSPQVRGPLNASRGSVMAAVLFFMRTLAPDAPNNAGCLAPLTLVLPPGSVVDPDLPAAVNARTATVKLACNAILGAWAQAGAGVSVAPHAGVATVMSISGTRSDGRRWIQTEIIASGAGGSAVADGVSGISTDVGNARNTPVEVIEAESPIEVECYAIRLGSGGAGLHRGGHGVRRVYRLLDGSAVVSYRGERHQSRARGVHGGGSGASAAARIERDDGRIEPMAARTRIEWHAGDRLVIETAGGGGWGGEAGMPFEPRSAAAPGVP